MYAVTGITGKVGGAVARRLLAAGKPVRAIVRDHHKGAAWAERGCEVAIADIHDGAALAEAFRGTTAVFIMVPPVFDPTPGFEEAHSLARSLTAALEAARPARVVYLSTIGADATEENLLTQHTIIERRLIELRLPVTILRPAWFMENAAWDVAPARDTGVIPSFLQPLSKPVPMVATDDIGSLAAELLQEMDGGSRVVELEGPQRVTPNQLAETFTSILARPVTIKAIPRADWEPLFRSQGMKNPEPRIRMLDGFNEGWIEFQGAESTSRKGETALETVLETLVNGAQKF